ncbi:uncharacterized protein DDB_G0283697-like isoform X2 [Planococcus citri]|uniref:uncharacterized protein DDB_G0283697-like isoform X2 n=1 Tax=Planococcus citri TaxID=170843 RepID=UPI0031F97484
MFSDDGTPDDLADVPDESNSREDYNSVLSDEEKITKENEKYDPEDSKKNKKCKKRKMKIDARKQKEHNKQKCADGGKTSVSEETLYNDFEINVKRKRSSRSKKGSSGRKSSSAASKVSTLDIKLDKRRRDSSDDEGHSGDSDTAGEPDSDAEFEQMLREAEKNEGGDRDTASERDSDAEFEQMLQEAEKAIAEKNEADITDNSEFPAPVKHKAKTKSGGKKEKKITQTTSKFPKRCEDGSENKPRKNKKNKLQKKKNEQLDDESFRMPNNNELPNVKKRLRALTNRINKQSREIQRQGDQINQQKKHISKLRRQVARFQLAEIAKSLHQLLFCNEDPRAKTFFSTFQYDEDETRNFIDEVINSAMFGE